MAIILCAFRWSCFCGFVFHVERVGVIFVHILLAMYMIQTQEQYSLKKKKKEEEEEKVTEQGIRTHHFLTLKQQN